MLRFHVHVTTLDLPSSIRAYSQVFGPPALTMPDCPSGSRRGSR
jgi:hypothetical protein